MRSMAKLWLHSGRRIGAGGFAFNCATCKLCKRYDGRVCEHRYCQYCFVGLLGLSGRIGSDRRRKIGAIARANRKRYEQEKEPEVNNDLP